MKNYFQSTNSIESILGKFPKLRPPLPKNYKEIYEAEYKINRNGATAITKVASYLEEWMHKKVAETKVTGSVLEIGAGTLNHLSYEKKIANYDIIEPFTALYKDSKNKKLVRNFYLDVSNINNTEKYKRVISIAVLEHLVELPKVLANLALKMDSKSVFQAGIPTEGGALWKTAYKTTTGLSFWLRNKLNYDVIMKHEHVNNAAEIETLIHYIFKDIKICRYPLPFYHASFYSYIEAKEPRMEIVTSILDLYENNA